MLTAVRVMSIYFDGFGRPLRNPVQVVRTPDVLVTIEPL